ncbi:Atxe2 family lasso peptide isopeptidase [Sphingobium yanoikuyae]|nr:Atxe2 family lasso peptide isopeptidase [Sphingobium yanoikuyae]
MLVCSGAATAAPTPACKDLLASPTPSHDPRPIEPLDVLRLRDIGYMHLAPGTRLLAPSPDGRQVAFVVMRADPAADRYCSALVLLDLASRTVRILDRSDTLLMEAVEIRGLEVEYGLPRTMPPIWSADGRRIAYLRNVDGLAQIIEIEPVSGRIRQATHSPVGVDQFNWRSDGGSFVYSDRPARLEAIAAIAREGEKGYLVDDRILPYTGTRPAMRLPLPATLHIIAQDGSLSNAVSPDDIARLDQGRASHLGRTAGDRSAATGWSIAKQQGLPGSPSGALKLVAIDPVGRSRVCDHPKCSFTPYQDIEGAWPTDRPGEFAYLRREGWASSQYGLYLWRPGQAPARLLLTQDLLVGCEIIGAKLLCARETALRPRHIVAISLRQNGRIEDMFDPNPDYRTLVPARVERLQWRNALGQESFGDILLPANSPPGKKLPLIIVQYLSRGFLRGGVGDEYPVQAFARNGFAVLSFNRPSMAYSAQKSDGTAEDLSRRLNQDWEDRRNIHASLMAGINLLLARGDIDPQRIGISGVSDGSTTVQFALINSPGLFKAASIGSCCVDPTAMMIYGGSALARERAAWGYPPAFGAGSERWRPLALSQNSPSVMAPLLMQLADNEFLIAMETLTAYEAHGRPIEARIFPDEHHLKSGPRHRLAIYCRNLRWFGFWLDQAIAPASCPSEEAERLRWTAMRTASMGPDPRNR